MYSPIQKFLSLAFGIALFVMAGIALANHGLGRGLVAMSLGGVLCMYSFARESQAQGAQPLTELKFGRTYRVEAMLSDTRNEHGSPIARLVVSWHVDYGHFEYRLVHLMHELLTKKPEVGSEIRAAKLKYGYVQYVVEGSASGIMS